MKITASILNILKPESLSNIEEKFNLGLHMLFKLLYSKKNISYTFNNIYIFLIF